MKESLALVLMKFWKSFAQRLSFRVGPGALLAEASLFASRYHCDAKATEDSDLRIVPVQRDKMALGEDSSLATALTRHLSQEVHCARTQAEILSLKTVAERVDAWMTLHDGILPPKGCWRQIASEIGVTPEALYRAYAPPPISNW